MLDKNSSIVNIGDVRRMANVFRKVEDENKLNIVYLGGSITQGCNATEEERRYVNLSAKWWNEMFPEADIEYFNAGIGATTSQFGVARVENHVLSRNPDLVFVEFSVNDDNTPMFMETYESLIRRILKYPSVKAVILINNLFYDDGRNAQGIHANIGLHYNLPEVSVKNYIYPEIYMGNINRSDYTQDMLHPNNLGHKMISDLIRNLLDVEYEYYKKLENTGEEVKFADKFTPCRYEDCKRLQNFNCSPKLNGFTVDTHEGWHFCDPFKDGWTGSGKGSSITFEVQGGILMLQWRRTINKPAPIAYAIIDNNQQTKVKLDANFDEDWGDLSCLTVLYDSEKGNHTVEIIIEEEGKSDSEFMIMSFITANE